MVLLSTLNEKKPPGGSNFAGNFEKSAFQAYIFPKGRHLERDGTQKLQRKEGRELARLVEPDFMQTATVAFTLGKELEKPSRLRRSFDEFKAAGSLLKPSFSSPEIGIPRERPEEVTYFGNASTEFSQERPSSSSQQASQVDELAETDELDESAISRKVNSRWYPHPCLGRGTLKLSAPASLAYGIDPLKDVAHQCPFFDAPKHRFKAVQSLPEARLRTPPRALRWKSDEHWNNPSNHFSMKVTHTVPLKLG